MSDTTQIAIITGGASGIGLAVGEALIARGKWLVYLLGKDEARGEAAADKLSAKFIQVDVTDYTSLANAFSVVFKAHKKINFVFANAGIGTYEEIAKSLGSCHTR